MFESCEVDKLKDSGLLKLDNYDCIGFDLDNTLCVYDISGLIEMEYKILANYLVIEKGYDPCFLLKPLDKYSIEFLQKGLIIDVSRGNLLKIAENGIILKASHGSRFLSDKEVMDMYGNDKIWDVASELCKNVYAAYESSSDKMRLILDYFDLPASLAFARIIDSMDKSLNRPTPSGTSYNVWPDVLSGLQDMYKRENFNRKGENFFQEIKLDPCKYIKNFNPTIIEWLKRMRKSGKITFLITGSNYDFASLIAGVCLGENWQDYFDVTVFYARKPSFFNGCRSFINIDGEEELNLVIGGNLELGKKYSQGNWQELYNLFAKRLNKDPKCLYFGDNLIQDVLTPSQFTKCHTVAVVEELMAEDSSFCRNSPLLISKSWGSYFLDDNQYLNTIWAKVIEKHSKICIPSLSVLAQYPLDHEFRTFQTGPLDGYFPFKPKH